MQKEVARACAHTSRTSAQLLRALGCPAFVPVSSPLHGPPEPCSNKAYIMTKTSKFRCKSGAQCQQYNVQPKVSNCLRIGCHFRGRSHALRAPACAHAQRQGGGGWRREARACARTHTRTRTQGEKAWKTMGLAWLHALVSPLPFLQRLLSGPQSPALGAGSVPASS